MSNIFNDFVNQKFVIPFGRIIQGGILKSPYNETMVGRKKQRNYLIRWLLEPKKNGCMLVTGTRGSGKTSFVNHCVAEHNLNIHSRLIQNNISWKIGDLVFLGIIFFSLAFILDSSITLLYVEGKHNITKILLGIMAIFPSLVVLLYGWMLSKALKTIKRQYYKSVKGETDHYSRQIRSLGFGLKMKSYIFLAIPLSVLESRIYYFFMGNPDQTTASMVNLLSIIILLLIILHLLWWLLISVTRYRPWLSLILGVIILGCGVYIFFEQLISSNYFNNFFVCILVLYMISGYCFEIKVIKKVLKENQDLDSYKQKKRYAIYLSQWSFPEVLLRHYVPSIFIPINLGFKDLRHANIIHAMLIELRDKYREIFLGGNYAFNKIIPIALLFLSLIIWKPLSEVFNDLGNNKVSVNSQTINISNSPVLIKNQGLKFSDSDSESKLTEFLKANVLTGTINKNKKLLTLLLNEGDKADKDKFRFKYSVVDMLGMLAIFLILYLVILFRPLSYQRRNIAKIDKLLRDFSSRVTRTQKGVIGSLNKITSTVLGNDEKSTQSDPLNSRIAEIRMIKLLEDISKDQQGWFLSHGKIFSRASPSIIFVFDELDKLHNHSGLIEQVEVHDKQKSYTENEAARTNQINVLLSDMKNFITTAKAKFIFVAGRDLHDQWLADANSREAFLTSIFDIELFIPSLLTDNEGVLTDIKTNIIEYVNLQYSRARLFDDKPERKQLITDNEGIITDIKTNIIEYVNLQYSKLRLFFGKPKRKPLEIQDKLINSNLLSNKDQTQLTETFSLMNENHKNSKFQTLYDNLKVFYGHKDTSESDTIYIESEQFKEMTKNNEKFTFNLIQFLTYRSQGNPKQLKRLFYEFIHSAVVKGAPKEKKCFDVLEFGDNEIIRIQFLADVFYNLNLKVGNYIAQADDKMATAIFYLSDFIMKFHDHAFSWRHLYRLDELAHIHRLPELQRVFESIVTQFSGLYLHKVLNGIFVFKFRSDLSKELAYLSKVSDTDSAAYNFTLDESGDLKKIYKRKLKEYDSNNLDLITGLGELYDLDKEFDAARSEYVNAIDKLDRNYNIRHTQQGNFPIGEILSDGSDGLRVNINWGNERLTLMLMLGQTYERDNRPFVALSHYRDARSLARKLIVTFLGNDNITKFSNEDMTNKYISMKMQRYINELSSKDKVKNQDDKITRHNVLKYFNILYQPLFAEAWLIEKMPSGLDTSLVILEKGIGNFRTILPFIKHMYDFNTPPPSSYAHSNFSLIASQFHNKTGDLAFFKGNQIEIIENKTQQSEERTFKVRHGYLLRSIYHYAVALHELRRFHSHRLSSSSKKFNPTDNKKIQCFSETNKPDYLALALSSNLMDIGESILAQMDIFQISIFQNELNKFKTNTNANECCEIDGTPIYSPMGFFKVVDKWLGQSSEECNEESPKIIIRINDELCVDCGCLCDWFGKWNLKDYNVNDDKYRQKIDSDKNKYYPDVLEKMKCNQDSQRLFVGLHLSWTGIQYLERGGYYESASKEYLELANLISTSVWWVTLYQGRKKHDNGQKVFAGYVEYLLSFSISCLDRAEAAVFDNKHGRLAPHNLVPHVNEELKKVIYPEFITSAYSLYLLCLENKAYDQCKRLSNLLHKWGVHHEVDFFLFELYKKVKKIYVGKILKKISGIGCKKISSIVNVIFDQSCVEKTVINGVYDLIENLIDERLYEVVNEVFKYEEFVGEDIQGIKKELALLLRNKLGKLTDIDSNLRKMITSKFKVDKNIKLSNGYLTKLHNTIRYGNYKINIKNDEIEVILKKWINEEFQSVYEGKLEELLDSEFFELLGCQLCNGCYLDINDEFKKLAGKFQNSKLLGNELKKEINNLFEYSLKQLIDKDSDIKSINNKVDILSINTFEMKTYIQTKLENHLLFARFPILNRLRGLSVLIYSTYLVKEDLEEQSPKRSKMARSLRLKDLLSTLFYYNSLYDSPFHFTHMESGLCAYLTHKVIKEVKSFEDRDKEKFWYKKAARKHLRKSISIHTMGKAFYENIGGLYYLYDDFNDRRIHMNHTLQMLGTSYAQYILDKMSKKKKKNDSNL